MAFVSPSLYGSEPPVSTRITVGFPRVYLTSFVPPAHIRGVGPAFLQGHALRRIFLPTTGSFYVVCRLQFRFSSTFRRTFPGEPSLSSLPHGSRSPACGRTRIPAPWSETRVWPQTSVTLCISSFFRPLRVCVYPLSFLPGHTLLRSSGSHRIL